MTTAIFLRVVSPPYFQSKINEINPRHIISLNRWHILTISNAILPTLDKSSQQPGGWLVLVIFFISKGHRPKLNIDLIVLRIRAFGHAFLCDSINNVSIVNIAWSSYNSLEREIYSSIRYIPQLVKYPFMNGFKTSIKNILTY